MVMYLQGSRCGKSYPPPPPPPQKKKEKEGRADKVLAILKGGEAQKVSTPL